MLILQYRFKKQLNLRLKEKTNQLKTIMFKNQLVYVHINLLVTNLMFYPIF